MNLQWILISILGCLSGHHLLIHLHTLRVISDQTLARTKIFLTPMTLFFAFLMRERVFSALLFLLTMHLLPMLAVVLNQRFRKWHFQREILPFLDELTLQIRGGNSLRESLSEVGARARFRKSVDLNEIPGLIRIPEREKGLKLIAEAQELLSELQKMDLSSARIAEKLRAYRKKEKMIQGFRQRSSQVTGQVRAQAGVCAILYLILLAWTWFHQPEAVSSWIGMVSVTFFASGLMAMFLLGRSFRWTL